MRYRIACYADGVYQEFVLPALDNADYALWLSALRIGAPRDLSVSLEVMGGKWRLRSGEGYTLHTDEGSREEIALREGLLFFMQLTDGRKRLSWIVMRAEEALVPQLKLDLSPLPALSIGKGGSCHIRYDLMNLVSREHATIVRAGDGHILRDTSRNGVYVNGKKVQEESRLHFGDDIHILGLRMTYLKDAVALSGDTPGLTLDTSALRPAHEPLQEAPINPKGQNFFKRTPRAVPEWNAEPMEIEAPPQQNPPRRQPLLLTIGPAFTMMIPMLLGSGMAIISSMSSSGTSSAFMFTGIITAASSAALGVMWALINLRFSKKQQANEEKLRFERYKDYLIKIADDLKAQHARESALRTERYPAAREVAAYGSHTPQLWNRNRSHSDFLYVRLGLGALPFSVQINVPRERFTLFDDTLAEKPRMIQESFRLLPNVPVGMDLMRMRLCGIYGDGTLHNGAEVSRAMAVQLAAAVCYTDVKLVFLYDHTCADAFSFAQWLPHTWSEDRKVRYVASNREEISDVLYALGTTLRIRGEQAGAGGSKIAPRPHYVVFVANPELLEGEPASKYLLDPRDELGLSVVLIADSYEGLPNSCTHLVQWDGSFAGLYDVHTADAHKSAIRFDQLSSGEAEVFARRIAGVRVNELEAGGDLPGTLTFLDMHGVRTLEELQVQDRWRKNRTYETLKSLIGQKAGGTDIYLDIHEKYHGPHGLVAGTTGSGKSETIQTFMLSLAINHSPLDVGFFIIDYKGGGMANLFSDLPHMVGQISNLSGNQIRRAMVSIKSEIRRRQRIFGEFDVNHIDLYTRLLKNHEATQPIPHLLIIIDEFAELKREEPDFMRELISVAQVGRSLGVHLILATQKPAGTVDDNIWSNSKFKLCLRVQDRQDSMDMLKRADAAYLTQAGRGFLQVGNDEIFELFQSGWSGAVFDEEREPAQTDVARMLTKAGQPALVGGKGMRRRKEQRRNQWLAQLRAFAEEAAAEHGDDLAASVADEERLASVVRGVFARIEANGLDCPFTQFNAKRVEEFLTLCVQADAGMAEGADWLALVHSSAVRQGTRLPELREKTQLSAVVEWLRDEAARAGLQANLALWLPVLPEKLYLHELAEHGEGGFTGRSWAEQQGREWRLDALVGLCDDPVHQAQMPIGVDFAQDGHIAVCGMAVSGKTVFLQTLLYALVNRHSPAEVSFYALDYNSRMLSAFQGAPHCGGITYEDQGEKTGKLFAMLGKELQRRKKLFGGGNYAQYIRANGLREPAIVLVIDGYANFREKTEGHYEEALITLSRDGANYGMHLLIAAGGFGASEIGNRINENIKTVFCLQMGDRMKYADILRTRVEVLPEADTVGRGLAVVQGTPLEFQTALCLEAEDDYQRAERMAQRFASMKEVWIGPSARPIPEIPEKPTWDVLQALPDYRAALETDRDLPFGYQMADASLSALDLSKIFTFLIAGRARTGKSALLRGLMQAARDRGGELTVVDSPSGELAAYSATVSARYVRTDEEFAAYAKDLLDDMIVRNGVKKELRQQGADDETMYAGVLTQPAKFLFIDNLADLVQRLYGPDEGMQNVVGFIENFFDKGMLHNLYVFACLPLESYSMVVGRRAFDLAASRRTGVLLGGNAADQRLFDMSGMDYREQTRAFKPGIALLPPSDDQERPIKIVVPLVKG